MNKYKWIFIGVILIVLFCLLVLNLSIEQPSIERRKEVESNTSVPLNSAKPAKFPVVTADTKLPMLSQTYRTCLSFRDNYSKSVKAWLEDKKPTWQSLIDSGYSIDEVTSTIEYLKNPNFAVSFRVAQLRKNSDLVQANDSLLEKMKAAVPDLFLENSPLKVTSPVPQSPLENFDKLTVAEKASILKSNIPTVDDVAYFIYNSNYSDNDILLLLSYVKEPSKIVGYARLDAISLLDYAVEANRLTVVQYLLEIGLEVSVDPYLGSTMEWALVNLTTEQEGDPQEDAAKIASLIWNKGGRASFSVQSEDIIEGSFPRKFYRFDKERIDFLQQHYGFDLRLVGQRDILKVDKDSRLIKLLRQSRAEYLSDALQREDVETFLLKCENVVANLNGIWNPRSIHSIIQDVVNNSENISEAIQANLRAIDPILVDIYLEKTLKLRTFSHVSGIDNIFNKVGKITIFELIDAFLALGLSEEENNYIVLQLLGYDSSYFDELKNSDLMIKEPDYYLYGSFNLINLSRVKALHESGASLMTTDEYGKTLVYYAAKHRDLELLAYMSEENFPYKFNSLGEDALHLVLKEDREDYRTNPMYIYNVVAALMKFNPEIDEFHLSRMALLKYVAPYNYLKIVQQYPSLEPTEEINLPNVKF